MQNKVVLPLDVVVKLTDPPVEVETVSDYRMYIRDLLCGDERAKVKRPVGRPPKATGIHKEGYTGDQLAAIERYIKQEIANYADLYTFQNRVAKGLTDPQTDNPCHFMLDNGLRVEFSQPVEVTGGEALPVFPPTVVEP